MKIPERQHLKRITGFTVESFMILMLFSGCVNQQSNALQPPQPKVKTEQNLTNEQNLTLEHNLTSQKSVTSFIETLISPPTKQELHEDYTTDESYTILEEKNFTIEEDLLSKLTSSSLEVEEEFIESDKNYEILETAQSFLGTKYVWAANGPSAFDCSGFTKYVFHENGIELPRHSGHQANIGERIDFDNLKIGDLVFFDTSKKFKHKVNHVGIYIGNHQFIHASSAKKKVIITSFDEKKFYKKKFLYARRIDPSSQNVALHIKGEDNRL